MEITKELVQKFKNELADSHYRVIIFWYDPNPERELEDISEALGEIEVKVWELKENNSFRTKYQLEIAEPNQSYLVYASFAKPSDNDNLLLDILMYSKEFQADDIALIISRYQLEHLTIRPFLEANRAFFRDKQRCARLEKLLPESPTAEHLKLGMLAVLVGAKSLYLPDIVRRLLVKGLSEDNNPSYQSITKVFNTDILWQFISSYFGIDIKGVNEDRLSYVFKSLVFNHFSQEIEFDLPTYLHEQYYSRLPNTCRLFIEDWFRSTLSEEEVLEEYLYKLEKEWDITSLINEHDYETYERCETFPVIESILIQKLLAELVGEIIDVYDWQNRIAIRKTKHWAEKEEFSSIYAVLEPAMVLYDLKERFVESGFPTDAKQWFKYYTDFYYQIDQAYRHLILAFSEVNNNDDIARCVEKLTNWYENVYLQKLAEITDNLIEKQFSSSWSFIGPKQQRLFYEEMIKPLLNKSNERIFVIISDALRYEAGAELAQHLAERVNANIKLEAMQSCLPSYTQLGMASLLPGQKLQIKEDKTITVEGLSSRGIENRQRILQKYEVNSCAYKLDELVNKTKAEGSQLIKGMRLVYLYHDRIDAMGDDQKSEDYTFDAVNDTLQELERAVQKLIGSFAAKRIFITSDHGFLYQWRKVGASNKAPAVEGKVIDGNRRFALGENLNEPDGGTKISLAYLGIDKEAVIATGLNRFSSHGGMQFIHGGALPQETIVPVIECHARKKELPRVDVRVAMREKIITNYRVKVILFQEQKISSELLPRYLRLAFYQGEERISNEITLVFDRQGDASTRHQEIIFSLIERPYKMGEHCILRMEDVTSSEAFNYNEENFEFRLYDALY